VPLESRDAAATLVDQLVRRGVIIRPMESWGLPQCVRISTGTDKDLDQLFDALRAVGQAILFTR
jgi:histidinol-phosphate/aromatic aminotransferase/cobyric acid decarboxylase-like protein